MLHLLECKTHACNQTGGCVKQADIASGLQGSGTAGTRWGSLDAGWALLVAISAGFIFMPGSDGRADGDFWWHLLYGQWFLEHGEIARVDWLSWTKQGEAYTVTQWLGQVIIAAGWEVGGWRGTAFVTWLATVMVVGMSFVTARRFIKSTALAAALTLALTTAYWSSYARPQIFGFVCMTALVALIESAKSTNWSWRHVVGAGAVSCLWANLHGSFVIGFVYLGLGLFASAAGRVFDGSKCVSARSMRWEAGALGAAIVGSVGNPHGLGAWKYVVEVAQLQTTRMGVITEWTPTSLSTPAGSTFVLLFLALFVVWAVGELRPRIQDTVMAVCMFLLGMMAVRQTAFATIAMVPIAARALAGQSMTVALGNLVPSRVSLPIWLGASVVALCLGQVQVEWRNRGLTEWQKKVFPVGATEFLNKHGIEGRLFNEATAGGWMEFHGRNKTFIDGRLDLHRDFEYFDWFFTRQGAPGWETRLERTDPEIFVIQTQSPLTSLLMQSNRAALVYADEKYSVLLKRGEKYRKFIEALELKSVPFEIFGSKGEVKPSLCGW